MGKVDVAVIGAGLSGMSAAFYLRQKGIGCRIFEKQSVPGGHAVTLEEAGYRFDRTGHLLHLDDPELLAQALAWIGPEHRSIERRSMVWSHGVYTRYPFQANVHGLPPDVAYACVMGFIEAQRQTPRPVTNFEEFCRAVFGKGISEHFMIPYNARLWGVPPHEISADWCQRFVPVPTLEDVIAGAVGLPSRELGYNVRFVYPNRGIGELSAGLARAVGDIELGRAPQRIDTSARELHFEDETLAYRVLVNTAPLPAFVALSDAPPEVAHAARRLRCTHLFYLDVALSTACGKPYHWVYVPEAKYPFYRVGCYSNFSPEMAPEGKAGLYVELVDRTEPDLDAVMPEVAAALVEMGFIARAGDIAFVRKRRIDHAYVIFDHDHYPSLEVVRAFLESRAIVSTGRYGGWNYSSMGDALRFGREAAERAVEALSIGGSVEPTPL
jgi:protoporphyrinogen oxidase